MPTPFDPNNPNAPDPGQPTPGQPQQPLPKPQMDKLKFEDVFDLSDIEAKMKKLFNVSKFVDAEEKKSTEIHLKYLKVIQTAERHKHTLLMNEKKEILKKLQEQMLLEKKAAESGAVPKGILPQTLKQIHQEFEGKKAKVESAYAPQLAAQNLRALSSEGSGIVGDVTGKLAGFIEMLPKLGTAMGALSVVVTGALAVFKLGTDRLADLTKLQGQLRAGGMGLDETARGVQTALNMFDVAGQDMETLGESVDDVDRLVSKLSEAPQVLKEMTKEGGPEAWKTIRDAMFRFGVDAQATADAVTAASKTQNMSMDDTAKMFLNAAKISNDTNMEFKGAFNTLMGMNTEVRNLTFNTDEARKIFTGTALALRKIGDVKFSEVETKKFATNISNALGSMTVDKLIGALSIVKGHMPSPEEISKGLGFEDIITYFKQLSVDTSGKLPSAESLAKVSHGMENLGISLGDHPKENALAMYEVLRTWNKDMGKTFEQAFDDERAKRMSETEKASQKAAAEMQRLTKEGLEAQTQMVDPLKKVSTALGTFATKFVDVFMKDFSRFEANFDKFVNAFSFNGVREKASFMAHNPGQSMLSGLDMYLSTQYGLRLPKNMRPSIRHARGFGYIITHEATKKEMGY